MLTNDHRMIMRQPATRWQDALPTGNGVVGAMMYGQITAETILLNHEALYRPRERQPAVDVSDLLPEVRRLVAEGRYRDAQEVQPRAHAERGGAASRSTSDVTDPYQPFCDIRVRAETTGPFRHYRRGVDFRTGRVWTQWTDGSGTFTRELFVSRATGTVMLRVRRTQPGALSTALRLCPHDPLPNADRDWGALGESRLPAFEAAADPSGRLRLVMSYPGHFAFGAAGQLSSTGGLLRVQGEDLVVDGAEAVVVRVRLFVDEEPEAAAARLNSELAADSASFDDALAAHAKQHGELFDRMRLGIGAEAESNEEMLLDAYEDTASPQLVRTLFDFGRYLLICSSGAGEWPANLQGVWNGEYAPPWNSDVHTDENIQMNYWAALPGGLPETTLPYFAYFERFLDDYRANAQRLYGCRGILVPIAQTTHGVAYPCTWTNWTAAAGWIGQLFHDYWLFTGDREFLATRAVPWLREVARFYEDYLTEGADGRLVFSPSLSPENVPTGERMCLVTVNATMDVAVCREVLTNLCAACDVLGTGEEDVARWRSMLERLPAYKANADGALREWLHPAFPDNYHHRHQSHLYPLFPGLEVAAESDRALHEACRLAVEKRLVTGLASQSGWSLAHMANIYARLGDGNRALECIDILARSSTGPNLLTYHNDWRAMGLTLSGWGHTPPFQIDANLGMTAAVLEMLVFSKPGVLKLLPALPDRWPTGSARGVACRVGITVDLEWDAPARRFSATLTSRVAQTVTVGPPPFTGSATSTVALPAGAAVTVES